MKLNEIFYLDFTIDKLYGFENNKSHSCIESLRLAIRQGDTIPPVSVYKLQIPYCLIDYDGSFMISLYDGGGHHRAIAHLLEGKKLPCICVGVDILCLHNKFRNRSNLRKVSEITIVDDSGLMLESAKANGIYYR